MTTERTDQGEQIVITGMERSAVQLAAAREAAGRGRMLARKPQAEPGGLFAPLVPREPGLFGDDAA